MRNRLKQSTFLILGISTYFRLNRNGFGVTFRFHSFPTPYLFTDRDIYFPFFSPTGPRTSLSRRFKFHMMDNFVGLIWETI